MRAVACSRRMSDLTKERGLWWLCLCLVACTASGPAARESRGEALGVVQAKEHQHSPIHDGGGEKGP
jgi:hypothetical protein